MKSRTPQQKIAISLTLIGITSLIGTVGFMLIEGYSLVDAIYMTVITMSTVGFGTLGELSTVGKLFSILLIIISASTFVYAITTLTTFIVEGEIRSVFHMYRTTQKVTKLKDHIILCGLGRNGREAALELIWQKTPFVVIEENPEVVERFLEHYECLFVTGDATREDTLEKANIQQAKGLISALSSDAENVFITLTAREMKPQLKIIARASSEASISKLKRAGADEVILPHIIGGRKMANLITRPSLVEFIDMVTGQGNPELHLEDLSCSQYPQIWDKTLSELHIRSKTGVNVIGFKRGNNNIELNPPAHYKLHAEDRLFIMGTTEQIQQFREIFL